jgi:hypothetical protein
MDSADLGRREGRFGNGVKNLKGSEGRPGQAMNPAHVKWKRTGNVNVEAAQIDLVFVF